MAEDARRAQADVRPAVVAVLLSFRLTISLVQDRQGGRIRGAASGSGGCRALVDSPSPLFPYRLSLVFLTCCFTFLILTRGRSREKRYNNSRHSQFYSTRAKPSAHPPARQRPESLSLTLALHVLDAQHLPPIHNHMPRLPIHLRASGPRPFRLNSIREQPAPRTSSKGEVECASACWRGEEAFGEGAGRRGG